MRYSKVLLCSDSGNTASDPPGKHTPPVRVNTTEIVIASKSEAVGGTKANTGEIIKSTNLKKQ